MAAVDVSMDVSATRNASEEKTDLTTDEVLAKIDELVNLANYLKRSSSQSSAATGRSAPRPYKIY